jgi:integrase/recombinase XerD
VADPLSTALGAPAAAGELGRPQALAERVAAAFLISHRPATRAAYRASLQAWAAWCASLDLDVLQAEKPHVEAWVRQLEADGAAPATVVRHLAALRGFSQEAVEMGACSHDPTVRVRRPRLSRDSPRLGLSRDQAQQLLAAAGDTDDERDHPLVCLLLLNGLRISETIALDVGDITDVRGHRVARVRRKGRMRQDVALAPRTTAAITPLLTDVSYTDESGVRRQPRPPDRPLFHGWFSDERLDRWRAADCLQRVARRAGLDSVTPHMLRHTFVTLALDAGVPLRDVQDAAGHADPSTTRRYDRGRHSLDRHATYTLATWLG